MITGKRHIHLHIHNIVIFRDGDFRLFWCVIRDFESKNAVIRDFGTPIRPPLLCDVDETDVVVTYGRIRISNIDDKLKGPSAQSGGLIWSERFIGYTTDGADNMVTFI